MCWSSGRTPGVAVATSHSFHKDRTCSDALRRWIAVCSMSMAASSSLKLELIAACSRALSGSAANATRAFSEAFFHPQDPRASVSLGSRIATKSSLQHRVSILFRTANFLKPQILGSASLHVPIAVHVPGVVLGQNSSISNSKAISSPQRHPERGSVQPKLRRIMPCRCLL